MSSSNLFHSEENTSQYFFNIFDKKIVQNPLHQKVLGLGRRLMTFCRKPPKQNNTHSWLHAVGKLYN